MDAMYPAIRMAIYLQDTKSASGGLKVMPGSHREDVSTFSGRQFPLYNIKAEPGDVIVFSQRLVHSALSLRLKANPGAALAPHEEVKLLSTSPEAFLPLPAIRDAIFLNYATPSALADLYIKNRALTTVLDRATAFPARAHLPEYLVRKSFLKDAGIALRYDFAIVEAVVVARHAVDRGDAAAADLAYGWLEALARMHGEFSAFYPLCREGAASRDGRSLFCEIERHVEHYRQLSRTRRIDAHMKPSAALRASAGSGAP
jgi:hypothetical protein